MPGLGRGNNKIYVGIPRERTSINKFIDSRDKVIGALSEAGALVDDVMQAESHRVDLNRDKIVKVFLAHPQEPEWLLMLDSDMEHPPDCGLRLREWRVPVAAALYFHRGASRFHDPMAFGFSGMTEDEYGVPSPRWTPLRDEVYNFLQRHGVPFTNGPFTMNPPPPDSLIPVAAAGTGCMLIHRDVLARLAADNIPPFEYRFRQGSEDLYFCKLAGERGYQTYVDMSTVCGHMIQKSVGHPEFMNIYRNRGYAAAEYNERDAIRWLSKALEIDEGEAESMMVNYHPRKLAEFWGNGYSNALDVRDFYKLSPVGQVYLPDLLWWNRSPLFSKTRSLLVGQTGKKVLEIGAGIGTVAIQLAVQGCDVDALEINKVLRDFADMRWRTKQGDLYSPGTVGEINFMSSLGRGEKKAWPPRTYDLVVAIDTFEHMHEYDLREMIEYISMRMLKGSRLFARNNWGDQEIYPMHFNHASLWEELMEAYGFVRLDNVWYVKAVSRSDNQLGSALSLVEIGNV